MSYGTLFLIPVFLGDTRSDLLSPTLVRIAGTLTDFIVENEKSARAFLKAIGTPVPMQQLRLQVLDEHTAPEAVAALLGPLLEGRDAGLMSEAGCPGIADPGSELVRIAHEKGIRVVPLAGPSSILLGLMASGLNGQRFRFHGYLPREKADRQSTIKQLEKELRRSGETQIFIETPYRNQAVLDDLLSTLSPDVLVCIGRELDSAQGSVLTKPVSEWKKKRPDLGKHPCIYLLGNGPAWRRSG